jgi:hypothetical protein
VSACKVGSVDVYGKRANLEDLALCIAQDDALWLNHQTAKLNRVIKEAVSEIDSSRLTYVPVGNAFNHRRLCDKKKSWIGAIQGQFYYNTRKKNIYPESFHPTRDGQRLGYKQAFLAKISDE